MILSNITTKLFSSNIVKVISALIILFLVFVAFRYPKAVVNLASEGTDALVIPTISVNVPIVYVDSHDETTIQQGLGQGVVHLKGTAMPGEHGNSYLVADSFSHLQKLPQIQIGDDILVTRSHGSSLVFKVVDIKIDSHSYLRSSGSPSNRGSFLTLQTSYFEKGSQMRYLVIAELK